MVGKRWTKWKMAQAVDRADEGEKVSPNFAIEKPDVLKQLDKVPFRARPDLVLTINPNYPLRKIPDEIIDAIGAMKHVKKLHFNDNTNRSFAPLSALKQLNHLLMGSKGGLDLTFLEPLKNLKRLELFGQFKNLESVSRLKNLREITLSTRVHAFDFCKPLNHLKSANIQYCKASNDFTPLNQPSLRELMIESIYNLKDVSSLAKFRNLKSLRLTAAKVVELPELSGLESLRNLHLSGMKLWKNPQVLHGLPALKTLTRNDINHKLPAESFFFSPK